MAASANIARELWWHMNARGDAGVEGQKEVKLLRSLLFGSVNSTVPQDAGHLQQIQEVLNLREEWLRENGFPLDTFMRHRLQRQKFLAWAKERYHTSATQRALQQEDVVQLWEHKGKIKNDEVCIKSRLKRRRKLKARMKSRWHAELQRRLGSAHLWYVVSFSGRFDAALLKEVISHGSAQTDARQQAPTLYLTEIARVLRNQYRHGWNLSVERARGRRPFSEEERALIRGVDDDSLRQRSNEATETSGFGRLWHADGTWWDIAQHGDHSVRRFLDGENQ